MSTHPEEELASGAAGPGRILRVVAQAGGASFYATVVAMSATGLGFALEMLIGRAVVQRLASADRPDLGTGTWVLMGLATAVAAGIAFGQLASAGLHKLLAERIMWWFNEQVLKVAAESDLEAFDTPAFHDAVRRARFAGQTSITVALAAPRVVAAVVTSIGLLGAVSTSAPILVPVALLSGLPLLVAGRTNAREMYRFQFGNTPNDRERNELEEILASRDQAAELRVFDIQHYLLNKWNSLYEERVDGIRELVRKFIRRAVLASVGVACSLALTLGSLAWLLLSHHVGVIGAATAGIAVLLLADQSQTLATTIGSLREQGEQMGDFLKTIELGRAREQGRQAKPLQNIVVDDVSFTYPAGKSSALTHVSLAVAAGEMVAIVGHNGSGKTTLAKLLCGLYDVDGGTLTWNGEPIRELDLHDQVGAVFQTFAQYWFTARENIAVGVEAPDQRQVERAAKSAGAHDYIASLPEGYDTRLAVEVTGGTDLSVGQWQRIAIARVLYRDPTLIVLDEPTASLDAEAEADLFETLSRMRAGRTMIVISHRFSTVRAADRIIVLNSGMVAESGNHDELMAQDGLYARMYTLQASAYR